MKIKPSNVSGMVRNVAITTTVASALSLSGTALAQGQVNVFNWSDYVAEDTISGFEERTGIRVVYDVYDSNEVLEARVLAGRSGYDVVVPTTDYMARQIKAGAYQPIDKDRLSNYDNLDMEFLQTLQNYDPDNQYGVPYQWGTTGIGYNVGQIERILGEDAPTDSWDLVFDPQYASQLAQCGIAVLDSGAEMLPIVMNYLGLDPNSTNPDDYAQAQALMLEIRPHINYFHSSRYISDLANGNICLAIGWSGDVFQAQARADEADSGVEIAYYIPKEGTAAWSDMMAIPVDAPNLDNAYAFIDYILDAQVSANITNYVWFGNPNEAAREFIDQDILDDPGVFPPAGTELFTFQVRPPNIERVVTRSWNTVKSGR